MWIRFGPEICGDRRLAEQREWLISNGLGSYGCGTVAGSRSRSYHGLLLAALGAPADPCTRTLLLAAVEEHWAQAAAGLRPIDHRRITAFRLEGTVPCWRFALGDALLEKRIWMQPGAHTTTVHYRLLQASGPLRLALRLLVNGRSHHGGQQRLPIQLQLRERQQNGTGSLEVHHSAQPTPPLLLHWDHGQLELAGADAWCSGEPLLEERERGLPSEDLQREAGWLNLELRTEHPSLTLVASTASHPPLNGSTSLALRRTYDDALLADWRRAHPKLAGRAPGWVQQLVLAADAFVVRRGSGHSLLAGYPWFGDWGRDTMISLSGLTLATGRPALGAEILRTMARHLRAGLLPNRFPEDGHPLGEHDYNTVDATLWFVEALRRQHAASADTALVRELLPALRQILAAHCQGTCHGIRRDPADGLLQAGSDGLQLTWMDAKVNGEVITPRSGKPVEVNALWCSALRSIAAFEALCGESAAADRCAQLAAEAQRSFQRFWNPATGCCFDLLDGPDGEADASIRPNQLLALAFNDPLLKPNQERQLVAVVGARLVTPLGLRSLDPADPRYQGHYGGGPVERDRAYHQGTVWGWWLGIWALALARVSGEPQQGLIWLDGIGDHLATAGLGSISEIFDGDPPHRPRGCIAQAWSVAETLRAWHELTAMNEQP